MIINSKKEMESKILQECERAQLNEDKVLLSINENMKEIKDITEKNNINIQYKIDTMVLEIDNIKRRYINPQENISFVKSETNPINESLKSKLQISKNEGNVLQSQPNNPKIQYSKFNEMPDKKNKMKLSEDEVLQLLYQINDQIISDCEQIDNKKITTKEPRKINKQNYEEIKLIKQNSFNDRIKALEKFKENIEQIFEKEQKLNLPIIEDTPKSYNRIPITDDTIKMDFLMKSVDNLSSSIINKGTFNVLKTDTEEMSTNFIKEIKVIKDELLNNEKKFEEEKVSRNMINEKIRALQINVKLY